MQKALNIDASKCTGCRQCELACSFENEQVFNLSRSRIKIIEFHKQGRYVPFTCTQCADAWCVNSCPVSAISVNRQTGAKEVANKICVGCKICTMACPFGTINYIQATGKVIKCDLCGGDPACAKACPTGAITYVDSDWTGFAKMKQWAETLGAATFTQA